MPIHPQMYDIETLDKTKDILTLAGHPPHAVLINLAPLHVTDCNRNEPGLQSARFPDHILCLDRLPQDHNRCI